MSTTRLPFISFPRNPLLRPFLILEFLIALQVLFTCWSQVGGQYHLDLMFWPWKAGLALIAATLIVAITACVAKAQNSLPRRIWIYLFLLVMTFALAGMVTYYYHVNEPADGEPDTQQDQPARAAGGRAFHRSKFISGNAGSNAFPAVPAQSV